MNSRPTPESILQAIAQITRMDRGTLSVIRQGPQGPYYNHQCYEQGRNVSRYVPGEQVAQLKEAIQGYRRFQELMVQYVQLVVDRTRAEREAGSKKKEDPTPELLLAQEQEIQQLMARFQAGEPNGVAVQQLEVLIRTALFKPANALVGFLLQAAADRIDAAYQPTPGQQRKGRDSLQVNGIFGTHQLRRDYYYHEGKKQGHYPADAALGLEGGNTPALARLVCLEGADETSYQKAENHLRETGGIHISARQIQRLVQPVGEAAQRWQEREALRPEPGSRAVPILYVSGDASGVPMRKEELEGRAGKQPDGSAKTRMAYLGCVFTQHRRDEKGRPVRDYQSTTYVSTFGPIKEFGPLLRQEAIRRGLALALQVVLLIDGATCLANLGRLCFPLAIQIVDFFHALEHAGQVLAALLGSTEHPDYKPRLGRWAKQLLKDQVEKLMAETRHECAGKSQAEAVEKELGYFANNVERMQYGTFRRQGFFIGSGVVEAGCKTVIGARCKQSGMFWGEPGAENVLALRCIHAS
ncbi:MAG: ISKra4 family transposase, partial [Desulfomonilaceae bacterium]